MARKTYSQKDPYRKNRGNLEPASSKLPRFFGNFLDLLNEVLRFPLYIKRPHIYDAPLSEDTYFFCAVSGCVKMQKRYERTCCTP